MSRLLETPPRSRPPRHRRPRRRGFRRLLALLLLFALTAVAWRSGLVGSLLGRDTAPAATERSANPRDASPGPAGTGTSSPAVSPTPSPTPGPINTAFPGLTTFRGNAARSHYGEGPLPEDPEILWRYPSTGGMCSTSVNVGVSKVWCGLGWTGQPNVIRHDDGTIEIRFGAYDARYHFLDGATGEPLRSDFVTGDLAKGSATSDPDGFPLYYGGSRDNKLRIIALDRKEPRELWSLDASNAPNPIWNNDWDGAPLIVRDHMLVGGENSWFYVVRLNRHHDSRGRVQVDPEIVMLVPGYDDQLFADIGDRDVSIESSVSFHRGVAYFANSGGLIQGWDIGDILRGGTEYRRVFRYWTGDDTDATVVIDQEGFLYVARHDQRSTAREREVGDLIKLDPRKPQDPVVWSVHVTGGSAQGGGIWSTPALYAGRVYVTTNYGEVLVVNQRTGKVRHKIKLPGPLWMSPVPIDDQLLVGDCAGVLHNYDISNPRRKPREIWSVQLEGCIEATPAVWQGMIWVGARGGPMYGIGDP
jgi:outer membrane protein assembly factor BamB